MKKYEITIKEDGTAVILDNETDTERVLAADEDIANVLAELAGPEDMEAVERDDFDESIHRDIASGRTSAATVSLTWWLYNGYVITTDCRGQEPVNESREDLNDAALRFFEICKEYEIDTVEAL